MKHFNVGELLDLLKESVGTKEEHHAYLDSLYKNSSSWGSASHVRGKLKHKFNMTHAQAKSTHEEWANKQG